MCARLGSVRNFAPLTATSIRESTDGGKNPTTVGQEIRLFCNEEGTRKEGRPAGWTNSIYSLQHFSSRAPPGPQNAVYRGAIAGLHRFQFPSRCSHSTRGQGRRSGERVLCRDVLERPRDRRYCK